MINTFQYVPMAVFVLKPSVRVPYFSLYSDLANPSRPLCYLRIFTNTAIATIRPTATTIVITEDTVGPT
jgi:hypothetical protein